MNHENRILVTGGAGYIGSHACKILKMNGYYPIVYDNLSIGHEEAVKWGPLVKGDLRNKRELEKAFEKYSPEAVMHFAANALVYESVKDPGKYYENNLFSTINLLETMVKYKVKYLIFSSTCATYGIPKSIPITEEHQQEPINPYGRSKLMIEQILSDYERAHSLKFAILRYFNAAGADPDLEIGENHKIETHLIPLVIETALNHRKEIEVFGLDYPTPDGSAIRDYIHVIDLIDAHLKALEYLIHKNGSLKLNLGTGKGYSVLEIINEAKKVIKKDFLVKHSSRRDGDPPILLADPSKAKKLLKWTAKNSDLKTIIRTAYGWHQKMKDA